jgi:hypothetical protein
LAISLGLHGLLACSTAAPARPPARPLAPAEARLERDPLVNMDVGEELSCAAHRSGKVTCRGDRRPPAVIARLPDAVETAARDDRPCARTAGGEVWCWWYDSFDAPTRLDERTDALQLADNRYTSELFVLRRDGTVTGHPLEGPATAIFGVTDALAVAAGGSLTCVLHAHGGVSCIDALHSGTPTLRPAPGARDLVQVSVGSREVCGVTRQGALQCWRGEIDSLVLARWVVPEQPPLTRIAAGTQFACGLASDGTISCWGDMPWPATGPRIQGLPTATELFGGPRQMCARTTDEATWCWGSDSRGQIGDGMTHNSAGTIRLPGLRMLAAARDVSCAALQDGTLYCWGTAELWTAPVQVGQIARAAQIAVSEAAICARTADAVRCRGLPHIDDNSRAPRSDATWRSPSSVTDALDLDLQGTTACALRRDGHVDCWDIEAAPAVIRRDVRVEGGMGLAQPGHGHGIYIRTSGGEVRCLGPTEECMATSGLHNVRAIAVGTRHLCALIGSGVVQCVDGDTSRQRPELFTLAGRYLAIDAYQRRSCAITAPERAVVCWGAARGLQSAVPEELAGLAGPAVAIAVGEWHVCVSLEDGTVDCRGGHNRSGELGNGRAGVVPRPRRLP